jgi:serine/threonine-protein kinase
METERFSGQQIDRYRILKHIARGGMADVYLAEDVDLRRKVAVKVMLETLSLEPEFVQRFRREAQTVAKLDHTNIVQVYSTGLTATKQPYIAMQFIEGGSLQERLAQLAQRGKLLTTEQALNIARQLALALAVAHRAKIVHRDLKPSNVLIRPDGTPVLVDLGIVSVSSGDKLTQTGSLIGTPSYMSPDQVRGLPLDGRSDIYSLGIILYEMLAGTRPFEAEESIAVLHKQVYEEAVPVQKRRPDVSHHTQYVVETCMKKDPAQRFQTAEQLIQAIDHALQAEGVAGPNPHATQVLTSLPDSALISRRKAVRVPTVETRSQRKIPIWVVVTFVVLVASVGAVLVLQQDGRSSNDFGAGTQAAPDPSQTPGQLVVAQPTATPTELSNQPAPATSTNTPEVAPSPEPTATQTLAPTLTATMRPSVTPVQPEPTPTEALSPVHIGRDGVEMRLVPGGPFIMGSTPGQVEQAIALCRRNPDGDSCAQTDFASEMPQREVLISPFYMDVTEVTNSQYRTCATAGVCQPPREGSGTYRRDAYYDRPEFDAYPVVWITWFDARDYCAWAGKRLPTEAEWEKGARGEDGRIFPWGNLFSSDRANTQDRGRESIEPAGRYRSGASPYDLLDMAGNVWEYVADWHDPNYYFNGPDQDPTGPNSSPSGQRVLRSGSYANYQHYARVANRGAVTPDSSTQFRGFRCVMDAKQ